MEILPQLLVNAVIAGSIYALVSSGLSLSYGLLRILNFAHGHLMMVGVYLFYYFSVMLALGLIPASLATIAAVSVLGLLIMKIFVVPFYRLSFILCLVTTLALSNILEAAVSMIFGVNVKSLSGGSAAESFEVAGVYITPIQIIIIGSAVVLMTSIALIIHSTSIGRKIRAISENSPAAEGLGISQVQVSYGVFIFASILAAYAGVLVGYETNFQPTMGATYTIKAFAAMILGGLGNIWGTFAGSYFLGLIENLIIGLDFGGYSVPAGYKDALAFMIILFVLLFRPQGLFKRRSRRA